MQSRVSSALAAALMIALGIAALAWYYAHALTRPTQARALAQSAATTRAQGEMGIDAGAAAEPVREELPSVAEGPGYEVLSGPRGVADDLKKLAHVSPAIEK